MSCIIVVGAQWGDEGKGKIIDILTKDSDIVVRFQGGNNAGHTVVIGEEEFILHLVPSGVLHSDKLCIIGNGVVVDPKALFDEITYLKKRGVRIDGNLLISEVCHIILPYHKFGERRLVSKIGTTGRGIGPCYEDKVARCGIRAIDLHNPKVLKEKLQNNLKDRGGLKFKSLYNEYLKYGTALKRYLCNCSEVLNEAIRKRKSILFEGAQGTLLDVDHGTYPYVTSSNATAGGACTGTGVGPTKIDKVIGVVKAYTTRVGEGPFPTEFPKTLMECIRQRGKEFGATTGRPRRCGWFDAVIVRHSVMVNGIDEICVTKLDVLDNMKKLKVCTAYRFKDRIYKGFPADLEVISDCSPMYEEHTGWLEDTSGVEGYRDLPENAKRYLDRLSGLLGVRISMVSVGSKREQAFVVKK